MLVLVSPTKTQKAYPGESLNDSSFVAQKDTILKTLQSYSYDELKTNMKISDAITKNLHENLQDYKEDNLAVYTYQGASFRPLDPASWDVEYAQNHLGILSALYGLVKPFQAIGLYRLDFMVKFDYKLVDIWKDPITNYLNKENKTIVSLASKEYESMIDFDALKTPFIRLQFKESQGDTYVIKSTYAKTARGNAANIIIKNKISDIESLKALSFDDYQYNEQESSEYEYVYTR